MPCNSLDYPVSTGIFPIHCPNGRLGQDMGFGGFAFALKLPELLNTNLATVRAKLGQTSCFPNGPQIVPNRAINLVPSSPLIGLAKWAPFISLYFCCLRMMFTYRMH